MQNLIKYIIIGTVAACLLSGCGIKGKLDLPEDLDEQVDATQ